MPELQFFKTPIFHRALKKLQNWVDFGIFSYLKFLSVFIINGSATCLITHGKIKRWKRLVMWVAYCYKQVSMPDNDAHC